MEFNFKKPRVNETIKGIVVDVTDDVVMLNINYVCDGTIYKDNFTDDEEAKLTELIKIGDEVEAVVKKVVESDENQQVYLSRLPLIKKGYFGKIKEKFDNKETICVKVVKKVNKGFIVKFMDFDFFLPEGQVEFNRELSNVDEYIGKSFDVRIIELDEKKQKMVVSRKVILKEGFNKTKQEEFDALAEGMVVTGKVEKIMPYGAFVSFGNNQGLLRISQISHDYFGKIEDVLKVGQEVEVKIMKKEGEKLDLSRKALLKTGYEIFAENHKVSDKIQAKVIQKLPFGMIMELAPNVTGMLHNSEFTWNPNDNSLNYVKLGDEMEVAILNINVGAKKIGLSKKALEDNPWARVTVKKFEKVSAVVTKIITGKGLEVLCDGVTGFIPQNELSNGDKISKIEEYFAEGDAVEAIVMDVNPREWVLKLSIRRLQANIEKAEFEKYMKMENDDVKEVTIGDIFKDFLDK